MSNKSLALLLVAAIIISLGATIIGLNRLNQLEATGMATGIVELQVNSTADCRVDTNITFGSSAQPTAQITISSEKNNAGIPSDFDDCTTNTTCQGLQINNTGNVHLKINFTSNRNASTLLSQTVANSWFQYRVYNGTYDTPRVEEGCKNITAGIDWTDIAYNTATFICQNLTYQDSNDMMTMEFNITLDDQTPSGTKTATIVVDCGEA